MLHRLVLACAALAALATAPPCLAQAPPVPTYQVDPHWPKTLPNNWGIGQAAGVAVDRRDHVWVVHRPRTMTEDERGGILANAMHYLEISVGHREAKSDRHND